jgi:geranylgeranyl diphosphate synthase, type II
VIADQGLADLESVQRTLAAGRELTRGALLEYVSQSRAPAEWSELISDYPLRASKGIRPTVCLAACRAWGGASEHAVGAAVAIELLHNAFLVHDDICDGALQRRGLPALHVRHGVPLALLAGNALAWLAIEPLLDNVETLGPELALEVLAEFHHLTKRTIEGQAAELGWRSRGVGELRPEVYLQLVLDKTCWYSTIHPCRIGALIGSAGTADLDAVARFGFFLGAVLQIRDDIENVTDRAERYGKDYGGDIIEGKPTLLLAHLLGVASDLERERVLRLVGERGPASGLEPRERIDEVVAAMESHGSIDYACAFADGLAGAALAEFDAAMGGLPDGPDKLFLRSLVLHLRDPGVRGR